MNTTFITVIPRAYIELFIVQHCRTHDLRQSTSSDYNLAENVTVSGLLFSGKSTYFFRLKTWVQFV